MRCVDEANLTEYTYSMCAQEQIESSNRPDGHRWLSLDENSKYAYIVGFLEGMFLGHCFTTWGLPGSMTGDAPYQHATDSYNEHVKPLVSNTVYRDFFVLVGAIVLASTVLLFAGKTTTPPGDETLWPTKGWATASPVSVGLDEQVLVGLDKDMASEKYSQMVDSFAIFRCGKKVFERTYPHDYAKIYGKEAGERGPYNERLTGRYNYFDPYWHPYYHGTDLHTMQSVSKTVTSVIIGVAMQRGDFT
jgi:hypothetical protein